MFSFRFFWKFYISSAILVLLTGAGIAALALDNTERALLEEKEAGLHRQVVSLAPEATRFLRGELDETPESFISRVVEDPGLRITLIEPDGTVVVDTHQAPERMDNHIARPEVQRAFRDGFGVSTRRSDTVRERMFYVAMDLRRASLAPVGTLRLSVSLASIDRQLAAMRNRLILVATFGLLGSLALGAYLAHRLTRPLATITRAAALLSDGHYDTRLVDLPKDELGILGETLNQLGNEVSARLREAAGEEAKLRAMLAGMVEGVVAVGDTDRVEFSNLAATELLGAGSLEGRLLCEAVPIEELQKVLFEARSQPRAAHAEFTIDSPTRGEVVLSSHAHRFEAEGRLGVVVVFQDRTELRRLGRMRRDFVANVSHELKTPLTSIRGYVETLLDGALEDEANNRRFLAKVEVNVQRLNHLVSDLLSLARIEEQRDALAVEPVDLHALLTQALRLRENLALERDIDCTCDGQGALQVLGDLESLTQVIDNLLDNAIRYTPEGGKILVRAKACGETVLLEVEDTGIGIPAEDLDRVFERFYRVDKARSQAAGGTGLGLSIVKHLVAAMDGEITVRSQVGVGTTFSVTLPRPAGAEESATCRIAEATSDPVEVEADAERAAS